MAWVSVVYRKLVKGAFSGDLYSISEKTAAPTFLLFLPQILLERASVVCNLKTIDSYGSVDYRKRFSKKISDR